MLRLILIAGSVFVPLAAAADENSVMEKAFRVANPAAARIEVDNVWGGITVKAAPGNEVRVVARKSIPADSAEDLARARAEVKLDATQAGDTVRLYVDGPFRCNCGGGERGWRTGGDRDYKVRFDFEILAPPETAVYLRTIGDGEIRVEGMAGGYDVRNINGGAEVLDAAGSGRVYALNGPVKVTFRRNPREQSYFGSLNGPVDLYFQPDLSADLRIKTFNGEVYSDFPVTAMPARMAAAGRRGGKTVYRTDKFAAMRVGSGGPEIELDGFNGDIRILKRSK